MPHVNEIVGDMYDVTAATDVTMVTMTLVIPLVAKADTAYTKRSTTIVTRSTTSISSKNAMYIRNLRLKSIIITRAKI